MYKAGDVESAPDLPAVAVVIRFPERCPLDRIVGTYVVPV